jgi:hypothetical protein
MSKTSSIAAAALFCLASVAAVSSAAEARSMGGSSKGSFSSKSSFSSSKLSSSKIITSKVIHKDHDHRRRFYGYGYIEPVVYASYSSCRWLKERALETGSPRWWARYEACRDES